MISNPPSTPVNSEGVDTYLVDQVLQQAEQIPMADISLSEQLSAMKIEIQRLSESLALLAEGTAAIARQVPDVIVNAAEKQVQTRPLFTLIAAGVLSFSLTRLMFGSVR